MRHLFARFNAESAARLTYHSWLYYFTSRSTARLAFSKETNGDTSMEIRNYAT